MPLPIPDVVGILSDNLRRRGSVLPIPARRATRWARDLGIPRGGETVLYTGQMYQLIPYIERLVRLEQRLGDSPLARLSGVARRANRLVNGVGLVARPSAAERREYDRVPANVARLLTRAGVAFGYLYEDDLYSGALTHDLGADEAVAAHARRVADVFRRRGVREVITIDPHTTTMLRTVFPRLVEGYTVRVRSYLEVLAERGLPVSTPLEGEVAIHDSCVYARYEGVIEEPRQLLTAAGLSVREPEHTRARTWCCGGPAESLFPATALAVAGGRVEQLRAAAPDCVTMCPICLVNLGKAAAGRIRIRDISDRLVAATGPAGDGVGEPRLGAPLATRL
ncbi:MAG: heterodisulfide reductase-related iron-sulfur binding cluster [Candidatus Dormibacteria bacterium]